VDFSEVICLKLACQVIVFATSSFGVALPAFADSVKLSDASQVFAGESGPDRLNHATRQFNVGYALPGGSSIQSSSMSGSGTIDFTLSHVAGGGLTLSFVREAALVPIAGDSGTISAWSDSPTGAHGSAAAGGSAGVLVKTVTSTGPFNTLTLVARATANGSSLSFSNLSFHCDSVNESGGLNSGLTTPGMNGVNAPEGNGWHRQYVLGDIDLSSRNWTLQGTLTGRSGPETVGAPYFDISGYEALSAVPLPPAAWSGILVLGGVGAIGVARRRLS
jgi:hypothetical protein